MKLGIIGGSLLDNLNDITQVTEEKVKTPFGVPSDNFSMAIIDGMNIVYLNRHGRKHKLAPHQINYRANMFALKLLGVTHVIAIAAVGGITKKMSPMKLVIPDQIIDYTYGRVQTYNDGNDNEINHIEFSYPFNDLLRIKLNGAVKAEALECVTQATYGVTQGPRLETIAEIKRMQQDGCDIVGMTGMPEAALARELEMDYANLSLVVNWAAGVGLNKRDNSTGIISMEDIKKHILDGNKIIEKIIHQLIPLLYEKPKAGNMNIINFNSR